MKILITGASGFLGQHLVHSLLSDETQKQKYEIYALYNSTKGFAEALSSNQTIQSSSVIHVESLDLTDAGAVNSFLQTNGPFDICLHLAALSSPRVCEKEPDKARALNIPAHLLDALEPTTPIVALSTDQVYGGTKGSPYTEDDPTEPLNVYAQTKVEMEKYFSPKNKGVVLLRSSILLGPKAPIYPEGAHDTFLHFCASRKGQPITYFTDECRSVMAVGDVVEILKYFCCNPPVAGKDTTGVTIYNMGGPTRVSRFDMAKAVQQHLGLSEEGVVPAEKSKQPPGAVASPLDITMTSDKLQALVGFEFQELPAIVQATFSS